MITWRFSRDTLGNQCLIFVLLIVVVVERCHSLLRRMSRLNRLFIVIKRGNGFSRRCFLLDAGGGLRVIILVIGQDDLRLSSCRCFVFRSR